MRIREHKDHAYRGFFLCRSALSFFFLLCVFILCLFRFLPQGMLSPRVSVVQDTKRFIQGEAW
jgi:hypothetical protein